MDGKARIIETWALQPYECAQVPEQRPLCAITGALVMTHVADESLSALEMSVYRAWHAHGR